jgi:hypothetical protein
VYAQEAYHLKDSIRYFLKQKPKFTGYFDGRGSLADGRPNKIFGIVGALSYGGRLDLGLGFYQTYNEPRYLVFKNKGLPFQDTISRQISFAYTSFRAEYYFYVSKKWELSVPLYIGYGRGVLTEYKADRQTFLRDYTVNIVPFEAGFNMVYLIKDWVGLGAGVGYRLNLAHWRRFTYSKNFSDLYFSYGVVIKYGTLYRKFRNKLKSKPKVN